MFSGRDFQDHAIQQLRALEILEAGTQASSPCHLQRSRCEKHGSFFGLSCGRNPGFHGTLQRRSYNALEDFAGRKLLKTDQGFQSLWGARVRGQHMTTRSASNKLAYSKLGITAWHNLTSQVVSVNCNAEF